MDIKLEDVWLMQGDCLERMKEVPSGSVDMILTDPPYGTTACKWDSVIPLEPMWEQLKRIIKPNGAIVMTASQPFTTKLISSNYDMFKYTCVWKKSNVTKFLSLKVNLLSNHEDICVFIHRPYIEFSNYLKERRAIKGFSKSYIDEKLGSNTLYTFFEGRMLRGDTVYSKPNKTHYSILKELLNLCDKWDCYINTEHTFHHVNVIDTDPEIKSPRKRHTTDNHYSFTSTGYTKTKEGFSKSVLEFGSDKGKSLHPTQKPVALMEYLIKTYTNETETVLDFTMGSGSTGVACRNTNRKFIGIEMDTNYYCIATERVIFC